MTTRPSSSRSERALRVARAPFVLLLAAVLAACSSSPEFIAPVQPRSNVGDQIKAAEKLAVQAQIAQDQKRTDEAIELYKEAVNTYRDFPAVWNNLGLLLLERGETLAAVEAFRVAGDLEPRDPRPPFNIGVIYEKQGWRPEAQRHYSEALARDANYQEALQRSVFLDMEENTFTALTLERTRRALLSERNPQWRSYFERTQLQLDNLLNQPAPEAGAITLPEGGTDRRP